MDIINQECLMENPQFHIKICKTTAEACIPRRHTPMPPGFALFSIEDQLICPETSECIDTGIQIELPRGCYAELHSKSGLSLHNKLEVQAGVIDEDYRGNIKVILFNLGNIPYKVDKYNMIAQLIVKKSLNCKFIEVEKLSSTARGEHGFGSSGIRFPY